MNLLIDIISTLMPIRINKDYSYRKRLLHKGYQILKVDLKERFLENNNKYMLYKNIKDRKELEHIIEKLTT